MKYFNPSYWFKLWILSVPLFNDKTQGINAISIDNNEKIKDWTSKNTSLEMINQKMSYTNLSNNYQPYNLNQQPTNQNINPFYQTELETSTHKHRHEKSRNRIKKSLNEKTPELIFDLNKKNNIKKNTDLIINHLSENGIINRITTRNVEEVYEINRNLEGNTSRYFLIPIRTENNENVWKLELLFTAHDLYLNGFILRNGNVIHYFHFNGASIQNINNANNHVLGFGGDYGALNRADGTGRAPQQNINRDSIIQSIDYLNDFITNNVFNLNNNRFLTSNRQTRQSLRNIILLISESIRFNNVANDLNNLYNGEVNDYNWNHFENTILNWERLSTNALVNSVTAERLAHDVRVINLATSIRRHNEPELSRRSGFYPTNYCIPSTSRYKRQIGDLELYYNHQEKNKIEFHSTYTGNGKISFPIVSAIEGSIGGLIGKLVTSGRSPIIGGPIGSAINVWTYSSTLDEENHKIHNLEINLGKINPCNYKNIKVLTDNVNDDIYTKVSRGNEAFWGNKITDCINGNMKSEFNCQLMNLIEGNFYCEQYVNLKFYKKNNDYYLQLSVKQYAKNNAWLFANDGAMWISVGKGFRLYNNDDVRKKEILNQMKLSELMILQNLLIMNNI